MYSSISPIYFVLKKRNYKLAKKLIKKYNINLK